MWSYASKPLTEPLLYETYCDRLQKWAALDPDRDAFVFYGRDYDRHAISRKDLFDRATRLAQVLVDIGLQQGDAVGFCMNNSISMVVTCMATMFAGGVQFFMGANLTDGSDLANILHTAEAKLLFIDADPGDGSSALIERILASLKTGPLQYIVCNGKTEHTNDHLLFMDHLLEKRCPDAVLPQTFPEDIAMYFSTSGSTGVPKCVGHSYVTWLNNTYEFNKCLGIDASSVYFCDRPLSWGVGSMRTFMASGSTRVMVDSRLTTDKDYYKIASNIIADERCTHAYVPGYLASDLMNRPELARHFQHVDVIFCSGERIPKSRTFLLTNGFCKALWVWYGSTEANGVTVFNSPVPDEYEDGVIGYPQPGVEVKLVNEKGDVVPRGTIGEVRIRSVARLAEYKNRPDLFNAVVDRDNWFNMEDLGIMKPDGRLVLQGRNKDVISVGTQKIFPSEVEKELLKCPGVGDAKVLGVSDTRLGEVVCACVVATAGVTLTLEDVWQFCNSTWVEKATGLTMSAKPKHVVLLDKFPSNTSGKIDKLKLLALVKTKLSL